MSTIFLRTRVAIGLVGLLCGALLMGTALAQPQLKIAVQKTAVPAKEEEKKGETAQPIH